MFCFQFVTSAARIVKDSILNGPVNILSLTMSRLHGRYILIFCLHIKQYFLTREKKMMYFVLRSEQCWWFRHGIRTGFPLETQTAQKPNHVHRWTARRLGARIPQVAVSGCLYQRRIGSKVRNFYTLIIHIYMYVCNYLIIFIK